MIEQYDSCLAASSAAKYRVTSSCPALNCGRNPNHAGHKAVLVVREKQKLQVTAMVQV
jgi:hypothetical protein